MFQAISRRLHLNIFTQVDKVSKWALYPYILLAALIARVVIADLSVSFYHPDEAFQYLEQAHRLVYGFGFIPWEYEFGIRSWAIPFFLASILSVCQAIGLDNPLSYTMAVKLVLCVVSLSLPISVYKISQGMLGEKAARVAFVLACFWYELLVYAHRPLPDILATYTLFSSLVFLSGERSVSRHAWFGLLMALTIVLRFQLLPVAGVLCALYVLHFQRECWPAILTFVTTIFFFGWLDYFTWGVWFSSIFLNLKLNFVYDIASYFGRESHLYYATSLIASSAGLIALAGLGFLNSYKRMWPIVLSFGIGVLFFHVPAHKEVRFLVWFTPLMLIGVAASSLLICRLLPKTEPQKVAVVLVVLPLTASMIGLLGRLPYLEHAYREGIITSLGRHEAMLWLSEQTKVEGIYIDLKNRSDWSSSGGYYFLNKNVPIYFEDDLPLQEKKILLEMPRSYVTHWITDDGKVPDNFDLIHSIGNISILKSAALQGVNKTLPSVSVIVPPFEFLKNIEPEVTPRF